MAMTDVTFKQVNILLFSISFVKIIRICDCVFYVKLGKNLIKRHQRAFLLEFVRTKTSLGFFIYFLFDLKLKIFHLLLFVGWYDVICDYPTAESKYQQTRT